MTNTIRWLHLSDFHVGKDNYAQLRLFDKLITHVEEQNQAGFLPDLVFITGDIANKGQKAEYESFRKDFFSPLQEALGGAAWNGKIFTVPGNHDVDRSKNAAFDRIRAANSESKFFEPTKAGKSAREVVLPRFGQYQKLAPGDVSPSWVKSDDGAFTETIEIHGWKVGIVGLNTAWLAMDDDDKDKLTPGYELAETALKKTEGCHVRFVLGHHPLRWLIEEQERRLRTLFGRHRVIYLHGHRHRPESRPEDGAGESFLVVQAGAAFQAHDSDIWKNGLLWGELDCVQGEVRLSPRYWNPDNMDWPVEGRFPEKLKVPGRGEWWRYPLPMPETTPQPNAWHPPQGWEILDSAALARLQRAVSTEEASRFFDGAEPDWALAQCPDLPRRAVVGALVDKIAAYQSQERPLVVLLTGPGGEGKSMALRQAVVGLLEREPKLRVLWRDDDEAVMNAELLRGLPKDGTPWLIATDTADMLARPLSRLPDILKSAKRGDVRWLLAVRESDWLAAGGFKMELDLRRCAEYAPEILSGLSEADAQQIAGAWLKFAAADGDIDGTASPSDLSRRLFQAAKAEAKQGEGALLGGVLQVRKGDGLRAHVRSLLDRLGETKLAGGGSLYAAFAYIAAMHAEGLRFLSRPVLAEALGCSTGDLQKTVLLPLGREAAAGGGTVLLTRHHRIAELAVAVMREDFGEDIGGLYEALAGAAKGAKHKGVYVYELPRWEFDFPNHFLAKQQLELAIRIGRVLLDKSPKDTKLAVNLARIYRKANEPQDGARVLAGFMGEVGDNRAFWYEWATCAGGAESYALDAWLSGWSLADQAGAAVSDNERAKLSLNGLGVAFGELYQRYHDWAFVEARLAVAQLGLRLRLDDKTRGHLYSKPK